MLLAGTLTSCTVHSFEQSTKHDVCSFAHYVGSNNAHCMGSNYADCAMHCFNSCSHDMSAGQQHHMQSVAKATLCCLVMEGHTAFKPVHLADVHLADVRCNRQPSRCAQMQPSDQDHDLTPYMHVKSGSTATCVPPCSCHQYAHQQQHQIATLVACSGCTGMTVGVTPEASTACT